MNQGWAIGLAVLVIILLFVAAVLLAHDDHQHDNHHRVEHKERNRAVIHIPLDFGAL